MLRTPVISAIERAHAEADPAPALAGSVHTFGFLMVPDFSMIAFTVRGRAAAP